jgi:hypothetical protein
MLKNAKTVCTQVVYCIGCLCMHAGMQAYIHTCGCTHMVWIGCSCVDSYRVCMHTCAHVTAKTTCTQVIWLGCLCMHASIHTCAHYSKCLLDAHAHILYIHMHEVTCPYIDAHMNARMYTQAGWRECYPCAQAYGKHMPEIASSCIASWIESLIPTCGSAVHDFSVLGKVCFMHECMHSCVCAYVYACMYVCTHACKYHRHVDKHVYIYIYVCMYIYICIYKHIHIHTTQHTHRADRT